MKGEFTVQFSPKKSKMAFSWNNLKMGPYGKRTDAEKKALEEAAKPEEVA